MYWYIFILKSFQQLYFNVFLILPGKRTSRSDHDHKIGGSPGQRDLLQTFHLKGSSAARIFAADDFKKFVTVDDAGLAYVLEEIPAVTF